MPGGHDQGRRGLGPTDRSSKPCLGCSVPSGPGEVPPGEAGSEECKACRERVRGTVKHVLDLWGISLQEQDIEDLTEEVLLKAIMSGHAVLPRPGQHWPGLGLACNAIRALVRRRRRWIVGEQAALAISHAVDRVPDPELAAECGETRSNLPGWIRNLPSARREVYTWIVLMRMTVEEVAIQTGRSESAVARLYQRAVQDLRRQAETSGDGSDTFRRAAIVPNLGRE